MKCFEIPSGILVVAEGDITEAKLDAIVNAANSQLWMGGGVAGAIKRKGGIEIEKEAVEKGPIPVGKAVVTTAGKLKAKYVIHAPTMEYPAMKIPLENAVKATKAALEEAVRLGVESVAFPAMGAGVGGLSVEMVSEVMAKVLLESRHPRIVVFIAYGKNAYEEMLMGVSKVLGESRCPNVEIF
ncbi:MAG: macro domain-containing protein [Desulfurococcales archaeon]|nr:macro domain-containing protein [Desulfurococcales archaeon]